MNKDCIFDLKPRNSGEYYQWILKVVNCLNAMKRMEKLLICTRSAAEVLEEVRTHFPNIKYEITKEGNLVVWQ